MDDYSVSMRFDVVKGKQLTEEIVDLLHSQEDKLDSVDARTVTAAMISAVVPYILLRMKDELESLVAVEDDVVTPENCLKVMEVIIKSMFSETVDFIHEYIYGRTTNLTSVMDSFGKAND